MLTKQTEVLDIFVKHFGAARLVEMDHPNIDAFLSELNELCKIEGKKIVISDDPEDTD